jgi:galactokinase
MEGYQYHIFSPYRVCPIGAHVDHQHGLVTGFAINKGVGLSSSAAVLVAYVMAFAKANHIALKPFEIVKIASEAEREYIGLSNGLLDQSCIVLGKKNGLLFLDCDTDEYRIIKRNPAMPDDGARFV